MLKATNASPGRVDVAQGSIVEHCCQFNSDKDLRGRKVTVDLGLFLAQSTSAGKLSPAWQVIYPLTGSGTVSMTLIGTTQQWQNFQVLLTAIDSNNFVVQLKFVQLADLNSYLSNTLFDSYQYFTSKSVTGGASIYDALKFLSVKATVQHPGGLEVALCDTEWHGIPWCENPDYGLFTNYFATNGKQVAGWVDGEDLTIRFRVSSQNPINASWYGGIIRSNSGATGTWWDDIRLQYGRLEEFVSTVNSYFDVTYLTDSRSLIGDTFGNYEGLFTIDKDYFEAGESYQVFFVYQENGVFKSCISQVFSEFLDNDLPDLDFDTENEITLNDNSDVGTLDESCVQGVAPCQDITVCTTIDITSFNAALTAAGLPYTFMQLYGGSLTGIQGEVSAYGTEYLQVNAPSIFNDLTVSGTFPDATHLKLCARFTVPTDWQGETRYVFILLKLALPGGAFYEILFPFTIGVVEYGTDITLVGTAPQFVCEDAEDVEFCFEGADSNYNFIAKVNGVSASNLDYVESIDPDFTGDDACLTIDYTKVEFEEDICFCLFAQTKVADAPSPSDCGCGDAVFEFTSTYQGGQVIYNCAIDISDIIPVPASCSWAVTSSLFVGQQEFLDVNTGNVVFVGPTNNSETLQVTLVTAEGCVYVFSVGVPLDPVTISLNVCPSVTPLRAIPCDKDPSLVVFCADPFYDASVNLDGGTLDSLEYTFDFNTYTPYVGPVSFADGDEIFFRALITYSEVECGTFELWGSLKKSECEPCYEDLPPINSCPEFLTLTHSWDEEIDELTLIDNNSESCDGSSDTDSGITYSFDGETYFNYVAPISTIGYDVVYYQWSASCSGCEDSVVGMWERPCAGSCAGGGGGEIIIIDALCDAMAALLPGSGDLGSGQYVLAYDFIEETCGLYTFDICSLLNGLDAGEPVFDSSQFIYIDGEGLCKRGQISVCGWIDNLTEPDPYPEDLGGLYFPYNDGMGNCHKIDISSYLGGGVSPVPEQDEIQFKDEGSNLGTAGTVTSVDFVGGGVTATRLLNEVTVTIPDWQDKVQYKDKGANLGAAGTVDTIDFVGSGVTATRVGDVVTVTIPGETADQDPIQFEDEGVNLGTAGTVTELDFVGAGVTATRALNKVTVTIPDWQKKIQFYNDSVALGTSGTVTDFDVIGTFGKMGRVSNAVTLDFGPYEVSSSGDESHTDDEFIWYYYIDASGGNRIVYLNAAANNGSLIHVKKIDTSNNTVEIRPDGSDTIDGVAASVYLRNPNDAVVLKSDLDGGTEWQIVADKKRIVDDITVTFDGAGDVLTAGNAVWKPIAFTGRLLEIKLIGDVSGDIEVDIQKCTFASYPGSLASIVGANAVELSSAQTANITLDGAYDFDITKGDVLYFEIVGTPVDVTKLVVSVVYEL